MFRVGTRFKPWLFPTSFPPGSLIPQHVLKYPALSNTITEKYQTTILIFREIEKRNLHFSTRYFSTWLSSPPKLPPKEYKNKDTTNRIQELQQKVKTEHIRKKEVVDELNTIIMDQVRQKSDKRADILEARLEEARRDKDELFGNNRKKNPVPIAAIVFGAAFMYIAWRFYTKRDGIFKDNFDEIQPPETNEYQTMKENFQVLEFVDKQVHTTFADVKGNNDAKEELKDLVDYLRDPYKYQRMGLDLPKGILLDGPPGTGKTLLARALAGEAGVPFITANGSSFDQVFVGLGAQRIRKLFTRAREIAPCIVFIDEIDAVGTRRNSPNNYSKQTLNQLLGEMDGFKPNSGVIILGATNLAESLDPALIRPGRFDRKVKIVLPDKKVRQEIIELYLKDNAAEDVDVVLLSAGTTGMTGSDLKQLVNRAGIETVKKNETKISMSALIDAKETITMGRANNDMQISKETLKTVAFHEAGHALVAIYTKGSQPIYKATILPRGGALGFVAYTPKDEHLGSKENYMAQMDVCMGGRAAEEIILGIDKVSQGASNDFQQASRIARMMVTQFGMSEKVGKVYYSENDSEVQKSSAQTRELIDNEVRKLIDESFDRAKKLLLKYSTQHHILANTLLEEETLSVNQIKNVIGFNEEK